MERSAAQRVIISSMDLFFRRDWADGAGPAVELANPLLAASPVFPVVVPVAAAGVVDAAGAAVEVDAGAEDAALLAPPKPKRGFAAPVVAVPDDAAVPEDAGVPAPPRENKGEDAAPVDAAGLPSSEVPDVAAGVALGAAPDAGVLSVGFENEENAEAPGVPGAPVDAVPAGLNENPLGAAVVAGVLDVVAADDAALAGVEKSPPDAGAAAAPAPALDVWNMFEGVLPVEAGVDVLPRLNAGFAAP